LGRDVRLKRAIDDLLKLEQAIRSVEWILACFASFATPSIMYARLLGHFKNCRSAKPPTDTATVRTLLTDERVRRATQLSKRWLRIWTPMK